LKIEKLPNNILKVTISRADFATRNIDSTHLKVSSRVYRNFINDIVAHAEKELGFNVQSGQMLVETRPGKKPGDFIVFVKGLSVPGTGSMQNMQSPSEMASEQYPVDGGYSMIESFLAGLRKSFDNLPADLPIDRQAPAEEERQDNYLKQLPPIAQPVYPTQTYASADEIAHVSKERETIYDHYDILCFEDFDELVEFCKSFRSSVKTASALYSYNEGYFLLLRLTKGSLSYVNKLENRALEFNGIFVPAEVILPILQEHGEPLLKRAAIKTLAENF